MDFQSRVRRHTSSDLPVPGPLYVCISRTKKYSFQTKLIFLKLTWPVYHHPKLSCRLDVFTSKRFILIFGKFHFTKNDIALLVTVEKYKTHEKSGRTSWTSFFSLSLRASRSISACFACLSDWMCFMSHGENWWTNSRLQNWNWKTVFDNCKVYHILYMIHF